MDPAARCLVAGRPHGGVERGDAAQQPGSQVAHIGMFVPVRADRQLVVRTDLAHRVQPGVQHLLHVRPGGERHRGMVGRLLGAGVLDHQARLVDRSGRSAAIVRPGRADGEQIVVAGHRLMGTDFVGGHHLQRFQGFTCLDLVHHHVDVRRLHGAAERHYVVASVVTPLGHEGDLGCVARPGRHQQQILAVLDRLNAVDGHARRRLLLAGLRLLDLVARHDERDLAGEAGPQPLFVGRSSLGGLLPIVADLGKVAVIRHQTGLWTPIRTLALYMEILGGIALFDPSFRPWTGRPEDDHLVVAVGDLLARAHVRFGHAVFDVVVGRLEPDDNGHGLISLKSGCQ